MKRYKVLVPQAMFIGILLALLIDTLQVEMSKPLIYTQVEAKEEPQEVLIETKIEWTKDRIRQEVDKKAKKYNISADEMWGTMSCESGASTTIQSFYKKKYKSSVKLHGDHTREQSFGLSQIHLPDHPDVTYEQAIDPEFSIEYMAKNWRTETWYCRDK